MANSSSGDSSLDRLVRILSAFDANLPAMGVSALSARANVPLASTYRLVDQLMAHDFVRKDDNGTLRLGLGLWELASRSSSALNLREAARPFMEDIQAVVGQHTQLGVLQEDEVLFIERLSGKDSVVNQARIAGRLPVHSTSSGVVLLAYAPSQVQESYLRRHPEASVPSSAVRTEKSQPLRSTLAQVRQQGYAAFEGLVDSDTTGIAVPVLDGSGAGVAALGVVIKRDGGNVQAILPALLTGARGIARAIGERPH